MHTQNIFNIDDQQTIQKFIDHHPFATTVVSTSQGVIADHIPLLRSVNTADNITLIGHFALANSVVHELAALEDNQSTILVIFQGDNHYISPSWYASKAIDGRVVPTWNYTAVHAYCTVKCHTDRTWLEACLNTLTNKFEPQWSNWTMTDMPEDYAERLLSKIIGVELTVQRLEVKFKLGQNQPKVNQQSLLNAMTKNNLSTEMTQYLKQFGRLD